MANNVRVELLVAGLALSLASCSGKAASDAGLSGADSADAAGGSDAGGGVSGSGGGGGNSGGGGAGGGGEMLGACGFGMLNCGAGTWCDFPGDVCGFGDTDGVCKQIPTDACPTTACTIVCGCDGKTYCNACTATLAGTDTRALSACVQGNGTAGRPCAVDGDCQSALKCCRGCGAVTCPFQCTAPAGTDCPAFP